MNFQNNYGVLRKWGRKIVLPTKEIENVIMEELFDKYQINTVIDFGAGTLYWSQWFSGYVKKVLAVDIIYQQDKWVKNIFCTKDIFSVCNSHNDAKTLVWICDVLHHTRGGV